MIAYLTNQFQKIIDKLKKDVGKYNLKCVVSNSVVNEYERKIQGLTDFLGNVVLEIVKDKTMKQRTVDKRSPDELIDRHDILAVERAFLELHPDYLRRRTGQTRNPVLDMKTVEAFVVEYLDKEISSANPPKLSEVLVGISSLALKLIAELRLKSDLAVQVKHDLATSINITPDPNDLVTLITLGLSQEDAAHVASAAKAQRDGSCRKAVFVTVDYSTIIAPYQIAILDKLKIWCTDPLYAAYHAIK